MDDISKEIDETIKNICASLNEYALYVTDFDGNITYYGPGSEMLFGWKRDDIIFKNMALLHKKDDIKNKFPGILQDVRKNSRTEVEIDLLRKDGSSFPVILTVHSNFDPKGRLSGYIFMAKDITERKKLEYEVFQAEKLAAIGQLITGITHELNNPLFVILGRLECLLEEKRLAKKVREELIILNSQAKRIRALVDRLLHFAKTTPPKLVELNIPDVVESVLPLLAYHKLPSTQVKIETEIEKDLPRIKGDLNQLQEVFLNLLINAYQAIDKEGKVILRGVNSGNGVIEIRVIDNGRGITPENLKNMFTPFFTTKKEGTGLGLSICYNIIKSHGGSIDIESKLKEGTTFIIRLPVI